MSRRDSGAPAFDLDLLLLEHVLDLRGRELLVARELDLLDDRPLLDRHHERDARPARAPPRSRTFSSRPTSQSAWKFGADLLRVVGIADLDPEVVRDRVRRHRLIADDPDSDDRLAPWRSAGGAVSGAGAEPRGRRGSDTGGAVAAGSCADAPRHRRSSPRRAPRPRRTFCATAQRPWGIGSISRAVTRSPSGPTRTSITSSRSSRAAIRSSDTGSSTCF